jgi:regulator of nonsense transcripts 2
MSAYACGPVCVCPLQENDYRHNQRRVAGARYLGELYAFALIDSSVIFATLYLLLAAGHMGGRPDRERGAAIDGPGDFFRIRLVCTPM